MAESYRTRLVRLTGPACIGLSIWCAAGLVSVASATDPSVRVVAPAPWWVFLAGCVFGLLVPAWRRTPLTALPALAATLPWWPVPVPAAALIWTGPLAWLPILAALAAAAGSRWLGAIGRAAGAHSPARGAWLAGALTCVIGAVTLVSLAPQLPGGDEPHYLVITQSLWLDGDLRIENNHARRDFAAYTWRELTPDFVNRGKNGEIYSIHAPGVSVLVLPGFALFGLVGAQVTVLLCLAVAAMLVWRLAWRATDDTAAAWFAWAGVVGSATMLLLGVMIFPDGPAATGTAAATWLLVALARRAGPVRTRAVVVVSAALAALPWLHTRFAVLAGGLGLAIIVALLVEPALVMRDRVRRVAAFLAVPVTSAAAWFLSFWLLYGTVDPRAPYRGAESLRDWIWGAVAGLFADQQFGLLIFSPVLIAGLVGGCRATGRPLRAVCIALGAVLAGYVIAVASYHMWWAGLPGLPARFLTATIPFFGLPLAIGWSRATSTGRTVLLALLALTATMTAVVVGHDRGAFAFSLRDGQAAWLEWLSPVANLPRAWPSFFWGTQGEFLWHVALLIAVWAASWLVLRIVIRRHVGHADIARTAVALWVIGGLMLGAEAGWRLHGVTGVDPARSQLAAHAAGRTWTVSPGHISRFRTPSDLAIRTEEPPLSDRPTGMAMLVGPVPAGEYRIRTDAPLSSGLTLTARIGRSREPLHVWELPAGQPIDLPLSLPVGAAAFVLEAPPDQARTLDLVLQPMSPSAPATSVARTYAVQDGAGMYFFDDQVFVEADGFWVRGERETTVAWSDGPIAAGRTRDLPLRNGGAPNIVTVRVDGWRQDVELAPGEERPVRLPAADASGTWRVSIRSGAGFRPSEVSDSADQRYLGVWVGR